MSRLTRTRLLALLVISAQLVAGHPAPPTHQSQRWEDWLNSRLENHVRSRSLLLAADGPAPPIPPADALFIDVATAILAIFRIIDPGLPTALNALVGAFILALAEISGLPAADIKIISTALGLSAKRRALLTTSVDVTVELDCPTQECTTAALAKLNKAMADGTLLAALAAHGFPNAQLQLLSTSTVRPGQLPSICVLNEQNDCVATTAPSPAPPDNVVQISPQLEPLSGPAPGGGFLQFQNPSPAGQPATAPKVNTTAPCVAVGGISGGTDGSVIPTSSLFSIPANYSFVQMADFLNAEPQELLLRPIPTKVGGILTQAQHDIFVAPSKAATGFDKFNETNQLTAPENSHFVFLYALQDTLRWIDTNDLFTHEKHDRLQICDMLAVYALARAGIKQSILADAAAFYRRITADHCFIAGGALLPPVCPAGQASSVLPAATAQQNGPAAYIYITQAIAVDLAAAVLNYQKNPNGLGQLASQTQYLKDLCDTYEGSTGLGVLTDTNSVGGFNGDQRIITQLALVPDFIQELASVTAAAPGKTFPPGSMPALPTSVHATWPEYQGKAAVPGPATLDSPTMISTDTTTVFTLGKPLLDDNGVPTS